jgi:hypothetical protein
MWDQDSASASSQHLNKDGRKHFENDSLDDRSYKTADSYHSNKINGSKRWRSRSRLEQWTKPAKAHVTSLTKKKSTWNETRASFREYRKAIEGHLLQADAGYLIDLIS